LWAQRHMSWLVIWRSCNLASAPVVACLVVVVVVVLCCCYVVSCRRYLPVVRCFVSVFF
jgi:hypothetical protein